MAEGQIQFTVMLHEEYLIKNSDSKGQVLDMWFSKL